MNAGEQPRFEEVGLQVVETLRARLGACARLPRLLLRWIALTPVLALVACGPSKSELDAEVRRLCAIDGGYTVHKKILLPAAEFDRLDISAISARTFSKSTDKYFYETKIHYFIKGNPELSRSTTLFYRKSDGLNFASLIIYSRIGGDFWGPWQGSTFACPDPTTLPRIDSLAFVRGD